MGKVLRFKRKREANEPTTGWEPTRVRGLIVAGLGLLTTLGVGWAADVDKDVILAVATALSVVGPLVQAWWTRRAVVPAGAVVAQVTQGGAVVAGDAALAPTGEPLPVEPRPIPSGRSRPVLVVPELEVDTRLIG